MSAFLASVTTLEEAELALELGVDVIDLKNPEQGALGALPVSTIEQVTQFVAGRRPVSATVGDLPMQPQVLLQAVEAVAATGVDMVKIGFFASSQYSSCLQALQQVANSGHKLIAVLFADDVVALDMLAHVASAGFYGVMLDTAGKNGKSLRDFMPAPAIADFVNEGHRLGLLVGLAGSLQCNDIAPLSAMQPDYLGFRGALCVNRERSACIELQRMQNVQSMLHKYHEAEFCVAA